jgi:hypothetical protein
MNERIEELERQVEMLKRLLMMTMKENDLFIQTDEIHFSKNLTEEHE